MIATGTPVSASTGRLHSSWQPPSESNQDHTTHHSTSDRRVPPISRISGIRDREMHYSVQPFASTLPILAEEEVNRLCRRIVRFAIGILAWQMLHLVLLGVRVGRMGANVALEWVVVVVTLLVDVATFWLAIKAVTNKNKPCHCCCANSTYLGVYRAVNVVFMVFSSVDLITALLYAFSQGVATMISSFVFSLVMLTLLVKTNIACTNVINILNELDATRLPVNSSVPNDVPSAEAQAAAIQGIPIMYMSSSLDGYPQGNPMVFPGAAIGNPALAIGNPVPVLGNPAESEAPPEERV